MIKGVLWTIGAWAVGIGIIAIVVAGPAYFSATQEAAAFNRFTTGPKATVWDALWLELRVEACRQ